MTRPDLAIVGGGLLGRLLGWRAARSGLHVALYEGGDRQGREATAWVAGGMITPQAETVDAEAELVAMGRRSLVLWPEWLRELNSPVHYSDSGTLLVWHRNDTGEARRFESLLNARDHRADYERLDAQQLASKEPTLKRRFSKALFLPNEAHIDNRSLLPALADALENSGVECHWKQFVCDQNHPDAALVVDCRGISAKNSWKELRGVRGEIIRLHAPGIELRHMIRLLHPRNPIYLISRPGGHLVIGATVIESDDSSPVSVRGALELLSAAYTVLPELGEARILELNSGSRPALPANRPSMRYNPSCRILEINGLYRHGFLLSPALVEEVLGILPSLLGDPATQLAGSLQWPWLYAHAENVACH